MQLPLKKACNLAVKYRISTIILSLLVFMGALWLLISGKIGSQFFPETLRNQFVVVIQLPEGSSSRETDEVTHQTEKILQSLSVNKNKVHRLFNMVSYIGEGGPRFFSKHGT